MLKCKSLALSSSVARDVVVIENETKPKMKGNFRSEQFFF